MLLLFVAKTFQGHLVIFNPLLNIYESWTLEEEAARLRAVWILPLSALEMCIFVNPWKNWLWFLCLKSNIQNLLLHTHSAEHPVVFIRLSRKCHMRRWFQDYIWKNLKMECFKCMRTFILALFYLFIYLFILGGHAEVCISSIYRAPKSNGVCSLDRAEIKAADTTFQDHSYILEKTDSLLAISLHLNTWRQQGYASDHI